MNVFRENEHWYLKNRKIAEAARVGKAILATGQTGVHVNYAGMPIILTSEEATTLIDQIADQIERNNETPTTLY